MSHLIHELCLCLAVTILLLIGGALVLLLTKAVEGFELIVTIGRQHDCQATGAITRCSRLAWVKIGL